MVLDFVNIISLSLISYLAFASFPCSPKPKTSLGATDAEIALCGSQWSSQECDATKKCDWNGGCCYGPKRDDQFEECQEAMEPKDCEALKVKGCFWDCDGDLALSWIGFTGDDNSLYSKIDTYYQPKYVTSADTLTKGTKAIEDISDNIFTDLDVPEYTYIDGLSIIHRDEKGNIHKAKVNPKAFFTKEQIVNLKDDPLFYSRRRRLKELKELKESKELKELNDRKRRLVALIGGDWTNRPNGNSPFSAFGPIQMHYTNDANDVWAVGVGSIIAKARDNNAPRQRYEWMLTAGHNCYGKTDGIVNRVIAQIGYSTNTNADPFAAAATHGGWLAAPPNPYDGNILNGQAMEIFVAEYREHDGDENSYKYDWCLIKFQVAAYNGDYLKIKYNDNWARLSHKNLIIRTYMIHANALPGGTRWRQVTLSNNGKKAFTTRRDFWTSDTAAFTNEGTSGSPWFQEDNADTIIGVHVGDKYYDAAGERREFINRITKGKYQAIIKVTKCKGDTGLAGSGLQPQSTTGISNPATLIRYDNARINNYGDILNENYLNNIAAKKNYYNLLDEEISDEEAKIDEAEKLLHIEKSKLNKIKAKKYNKYQRYNKYNRYQQRLKVKRGRSNHYH